MAWLTNQETCDCFCASQNWNNSARADAERWVLDMWLSNISVAHWFLLEKVCMELRALDASSSLFLFMLCFAYKNVRHNSIEINCTHFFRSEKDILTFTSNFMCPEWPLLSYPGHALLKSNSSRNICGMISHDGLQVCLLRPLLALKTEQRWTNIQSSVKLP